MEKATLSIGKSTINGHCWWPFSIAMFNYQQIKSMYFPQIIHFSEIVPYKPTSYVQNVTCHIFLLCNVPGGWTICAWSLNTMCGCPLGAPPNMIIMIIYESHRTKYQFNSGFAVRTLLAMSPCHGHVSSCIGVSVYPQFLYVVTRHPCSFWWIKGNFTHHAPRSSRTRNPCTLGSLGTHCRPRRLPIVLEWNVT